MTVVPIVDEGLGNTSYLVDLGDGRALAVDPSRDVRGVRAHGLPISYVAETHLHADFLSGACQLASTDGAQVLASAAGSRSFEHAGLGDGDSVDLGGLTLQAISTPGHTDEHVSYVLYDGDTPIGVFTGGSLIVGAAARTDLVNPERTEELARAQCRSLQRLMQLPDDVAVWPTHGAGSFCSATPGAQRVSTIGQERRSNPLLQVPDEDEFVRALVNSLGDYPTYFRRLAEVNRCGPDVIDEPPLMVALPVSDVRALVDQGLPIVDVRPIAQFAAAHIPGSLSIELRPVFATWLGWLLPADSPIVVVRDEAQDADDIAWQAAKVGYPIAGELAGGLNAWSHAGLPIASIELLNNANDRTLIDLHDDARLGTLDATELPTTPLAFQCGHGQKAMSGASLVRRGGREDIAVVL